MHQYFIILIAKFQSMGIPYLVIHLSAKEHLDRYHFMAIMANALMNIHVQVLV